MAQALHIMPFALEAAGWPNLMERPEASSTSSGGAGTALRVISWLSAVWAPHLQTQITVHVSPCVAAHDPLTLAEPGRQHNTLKDANTPRHTYTVGFHPMYASGATCRHVHRVQLPARNSYSPTCNDQGVYQPTIDHYNVYKTLPQTTDANGTVFPPP